jgi:hypothetical protein
LGFFDFRARPQRTLHMGAMLPKRHKGVTLKHFTKTPVSNFALAMAIVSQLQCFC